MRAILGFIALFVTVLSAGFSYAQEAQVIPKTSPTPIAFHRALFESSSSPALEALSPQNPWYCYAIDTKAAEQKVEVKGKSNPSDDIDDLGISFEATPAPAKTKTELKVMLSLEARVFSVRGSKKNPRIVMARSGDLSLRQGEIVRPTENNFWIVGNEKIRLTENGSLVIEVANGARYEVCALSRSSISALINRWCQLIPSRYLPDARQICAQPKQINNRLRSVIEKLGEPSQN